MITNWFSSERIILRAVEPEDTYFMSQAECDPLNIAFTGYTAPFSERQLADYALTYDADPFRARQLRLIACKKDENMPIGIFDLTEIDQRDMHAFIGIYVTPDFRRTGIGKEILALGARYASEVLRLSTLAAKIAEDNDPSIRLFESAGYQKKGCLNKWIYSPVSISMVDMYFYQLSLY